VTEGAREQGRGVGGMSTRTAAWLAWAVCALSLALTALCFLLIALSLSLNTPIYFFSNLRRSGHQADTSPRRGSARYYPGRGAVRGRRPLPPRAQRLQAARRGQRKRSQIGGDDSLLRAHPRSGDGPLPRYPLHPRGATVRAGCLRDDAISGVPARAPCTVEVTEHGLFTERRRGTS
jgi:hypothetical protein